MSKPKIFYCFYYSRFKPTLQQSIYIIAKCLFITCLKTVIFKNPILMSFAQKYF